MPRAWQPNGSNAEYWRSDNPLIQGWWRFGNDLPKNAYLSPDEANSSTAYLSGLLKDSGPQKHHLKPFWRSGASDSDRLIPVPSIAPWDPTGSGCEINWVDTTLPDFLYVDPGVHLQNGDAATDHGTLGNGVNMYSGLTIIGWTKIPNVLGSSRFLMGRADQDTALATHLQWRIIWSRPTANTSTIAFTYLSQVNFIFNGISTSPTRVLQECQINEVDFPNFPGDRTLPFFFAVQIQREAVEGNRSFTGNGSGIARIWCGTEASGITCKIERFFRGQDVDLTWISPDLIGVPMTFFGESRGLRSATGTTRKALDGTILDEVVIVNDGFMSEDRILHYALSGMTHITSSDPERPDDFVPEFPGSSGLKAYWSFDDDTGHNTAPTTLNDPRLELSLSGLGDTIGFADGIRGGRCITVEPNNAMVNTTDGETMLNRRDYPLIPAASGLSLLWPSGHVIDEGMTYIGWMRSVPTGTILGGGFGWYGGNGRHLAFASDSLASVGILAGRNAVSVSAPPSGGTALVTNVRVVSDDTVASNNAPGAGYGVCTTAAVINSEWDNHEDAWHLWAMVYDLKAGMIYLVKDAKHVFPMTQQLSSASGVSSDGFGPFQGFFGLVPRGTMQLQYDDIAVYNRILSIPEMSGFAINGIEGAPLVTDIDTSFKSLVGYWPFNRFTNYDPVGVSGYRIDDKSWYFHHLTNVSGSFDLSTALNSELASVAPSSLRVNTSGAMISLERTFHGSNLDASDANVFSTSGFSAGAWVYIPSGDLQTQGNGSSGLYGTHMIMGAWGEVDSDRSWFLGIEGNRLALKFVEEDGTLNSFTSNVEPAYNAPFFVGCNIFPSGLTLRAQLVKIDQNSKSPPQYAIDTIFSFSNAVAQSVGSSGISFLNAPGRQWGFPSGTRLQHAFVHLGYLNDDRWLRVKRDGINITTLTSGSVSVNDPENISHWRFDRPGKLAIDHGRESNHLYAINTDGHLIGVERSIHSSGVVVRQPEYLDTLPSNPSSRRLDIGSGSQSWTFLTWLIPPVISNTDQHVIMNKGSGPSASPTGIQIYTPPDSLTPIAIAANLEAAAKNGDLAPGELNHLAVTYDRDNNEFCVIVNGRYAGTSFITLQSIQPNNSGLSLGGRGDQVGNALNGGSSFSGLLDDSMLFSRVLTLPEISGLAANSYNFNGGAQTLTATIGAWISGIPQNIISGLIGTYIHGQAQDVELIAGYVSGVSGVVGDFGGYIHGSARVSGLAGAFTHGLASQSGLFSHFIHGLGIASGLIGSYQFGASLANDEFDVTLTFQIVTSKDFDARLGVEKTEIYDFDSRLGVVRITRPPDCSIEVPEIGLIASGTPYTLTVQGSGIAYENKKVSLVRFTFADFKGAELGTLVDGVPFSGLYEAGRTFDTPGWYTIKIEVLDSYGYRSSCARPFLLVPSGSTSGAYLATLPGISISRTPAEGSAIQRVFLTHSLSGLETTSGVLEYTDFADQQETLVNSLEMPSGTQFIDFVRTHDYTMPGHYVPVWAASGSWGIVSDSLSGGIDYLG